MDTQIGKTEVDTDSGFVSVIIDDVGTKVFACLMPIRDEEGRFTGEYQRKLGNCGGDMLEGVCRESNRAALERYTEQDIEDRFFAYLEESGELEVV